MPWHILVGKEGDMS